jgi:hypothetical protein
LRGTARRRVRSRRIGKRRHADAGTGKAVTRSLRPVSRRPFAGTAARPAPAPFGKLNAGYAYNRPRQEYSEHPPLSFRLIAPPSAVCRRSFNSGPEAFFPAHPHRRSAGCPYARAASRQIVLSGICFSGCGRAALGYIGRKQLYFRTVRDILQKKSADLPDSSGPAHRIFLTPAIKFSGRAAGKADPHGDACKLLCCAATKFYSTAGLKSP